ncbi:MAG: sugar phosphate isomerase/epimerase family protein [Thermogutta sp.]
MLEVSVTRRGFVASGTLGLLTSGLLPGSVAAGLERNETKIPFRLALASYTLRAFPLTEALAMTQRVGLKHICLKSFHLPLEASPEEIARVRREVADAGIDLYGGGVINMANEDEVNHAFTYAAAAGMRVIVASPDPALLPLLDRRIRETGIAVAIHNHGPGDKKFPTPESVYERVQPFDKRLGLCMDIGHTVRSGADPIADAERFADRLIDVHLKDVDQATPAGKCVEAGRGVIDLPGFIRKLIEIRFSGMAAFEYEKDQNDPLPGLAETVGYVNGVVDTLVSR